MRPRHFFRGLLVAFGLGALFLYFNNASWRAKASAEPARLLAHRGVHHTFSLEGVANDSCTATRIRSPLATEFENTIGSMQAAFELGAHVVELDIHPTTDGKFAVFHDWTIDCRTNGRGVTREQSMAFLKTLDIGYGYTADGGKTYPLRGKGVGLMPTLSEVMNSFPDKAFLINFKSNVKAEGEKLAALLMANPQWQKSVWGVYGGDKPTDATLNQVKGLRGLTGNSVKNCLLDYVKIGWSGYIPKACHDTIIQVPINYRYLMWGWPHLFTQRMKSVGTNVILRGAYDSGLPTGGIDRSEDIDRIPVNFDGYIWTNEIEFVAPYFRAK